MAFSDRTIEEIKSRLSIVDVVSSYTQVLQRNNGFWIRCPFHGNGNERTPSCKLNMERGSYYCFACHEHGSMFDFVMKMDKVTFPESVRMLAQKAGVAIEDESPADAKRKEEKTSLYELNEQMARTFHDMLMSSQEAEEARLYLARRKITDETRLLQPQQLSLSAFLQPPDVPRQILAGPCRRLRSQGPDVP